VSGRPTLGLLSLAALLQATSACLIIEHRTTPQSPPPPDIKKPAIGYVVVPANTTLYRAPTGAQEDVIDWDATFDRNTSWRVAEARGAWLTLLPLTEPEAPVDCYGAVQALYPYHLPVYVRAGDVAYTVANEQRFEFLDGSGLVLAPGVRIDPPRSGPNAQARYRVHITSDWVVEVPLGPRFSPAIVAFLRPDQVHAKGRLTGRYGQRLTDARGVLAGRVVRVGGASPVGIATKLDKVAIASKCGAVQLAGASDIKAEALGSDLSGMARFRYRIGQLAPLFWRDGRAAGLTRVKVRPLQVEVTGKLACWPVESTDLCVETSRITRSDGTPVVAED